MSEATPSCDYCGLPVRGLIRRHGEPLFCCLGCRLAASITSSTDEDEPGLSRSALRLGLAIFFSMNVMVFTMALWSWDTYAIASTPHAVVLKDLLRLACLLFSTPVVLILGSPFAANVASQLRDRVVTVDALLILGIAAAFAYSVFSILSGGEHIYFEVACMILVAVTLGKWLEAEGKHRAMKSLQSLQKLLPDKARLVSTDGRIVKRPLSRVTAGQLIRVLPGERIPLDGTIESGQSYVDQQLVTGESFAETRAPGDPVYGGTANLDGCLDIRVAAGASAGVIQRILDSVRQAAERPSQPQRLADRLATFFVPAVMVIAVVVLVWHLNSAGPRAALMASMAVTLIACPCALAIATPLAVWAGLGHAGQHGVVFRTSDDLLGLAVVDHVCIDKTGTVTTGSPRFVTVCHGGAATHDPCEVAVRLARQTQHPLAAALVAEFGDSVEPVGIDLAQARTMPGKGVAGELTVGHKSTVAVLGSATCCEELGLQMSSELAEQYRQALLRGQSIVFVGWDERVEAMFAFEESLRPDARHALSALRQLGVSVSLLTGDQTERATRVARQLGVDVVAGVLPEAKQTVVQRWQAEGQHVAMVGDGLNDAPALRAADVGIALGCGVEVTRDAADVCLLPSQLALLPWSIQLARRTRWTIRRNLLWAVIYNSVGIGFAASGTLNPIFAAAAMVLSSGFVTVESLRLCHGPGPPRTSETVWVQPEALPRESDAVGSPWVAGASG